LTARLRSKHQLLHHVYPKLTAIDPRAVLKRRAARPRWSPVLPFVLEPYMMAQVRFSAAVLPPTMLSCPIRRLLISLLAVTWGAGDVACESQGKVFTSESAGSRMIRGVAGRCLYDCGVSNRAWGLSWCERDVEANRHIEWKCGGC
jgi:hypothetical protein